MATETPKTPPVPASVTLNAEQLAGMVKAMMQEMMKEMVPAIIAAARPPPAPSKQTEVLERCPDCRQFKVACKGEHVQMIVFPQSRTAMKAFQGCYLNGVKYLSNHPRHSITVPKHNSFTSDLLRYEINEEELKEGRQAHHDSGVINGVSGDRSGFNPALGFRPLGFGGHAPN